MSSGEWEMEFLERNKNARNRARKLELIRTRLEHLLQDDPENDVIEVLAASFDRASYRYDQALAGLAPDVAVQSLGNVS
jgi:hypothetical protein